MCTSCSASCVVEFAELNARGTARSLYRCINLLLAKKSYQVKLFLCNISSEGGVCQNTAPAISLHPTGGVHIQGDPVTLSCRTTTEVSSIEWFKDDQLLGSGPQFSIESFSESQAGNYTCRATTNGVGTVTSASARLQLAGNTFMCVRTATYARVTYMYSM